MHDVAADTASELHCSLSTEPRATQLLALCALPWDDTMAVGLDFYSISRISVDSTSTSTRSTRRVSVFAAALPSTTGACQNVAARDGHACPCISYLTVAQHVHARPQGCRPHMMAAHVVKGMP
jgi:hypothetical protein